MNDRWMKKEHTEYTVWCVMDAVQDCIAIKHLLSDQERLDLELAAAQLIAIVQRKAA